MQTDSKENGDAVMQGAPQSFSAMALSDDEPLFKRKTDASSSADVMVCVWHVCVLIMCRCVCQCVLVVVSSCMCCCGYQDDFNRLPFPDDEPDGAPMLLESDTDLLKVCWADNTL